MISLIQLKYLVAISEEGSFVRAAESLNVTQPALTSQILNLEDDLGVKLIDRTTKPVQPTETGRQIIEQAMLVLQETAKIKDLALSLTLQMSSKLVLGIIPTISPYLVPLFANAFHEKYPDAQLIVKEMLTDDVVHAVKSGAIDAGILAAPIELRNVLLMPLYKERIMLYCSTYHPFYSMKTIPAEALESEDIWFLREGNCFRNQVLNLCADTKPTTSKFRYESNSIDSLIRVVDSQNGVTFIPELAIETLSAKRRENIRKVEQMEAGRQVSLVVNKAFLKKRLIKETVQLIHENLPKQILSNEHINLLETKIKI